MNRQTRLLLCAAVLSPTMLFGTATASAQEHSHTGAGAAALIESTVTTVRAGRWSDPAVWSTGRVPVGNDSVRIMRGMEVVLDTSPPDLRSLTIDGKLSFAMDRDIDLATEWIYVAGGELEIGTETDPYTHNATITLTDKVPGEDVNTMGDRGIILLGGTLNIHGNRDHSWTKLAATAEAGATRIEVLDASGWRLGDEIVLASTDFNPRQAERRKIAAIQGNTITLDQPLEYMHFGEITFGVDQRGEVGMLTRNIRVQASEDSDETYFGGHIMAMAGSKMYVDGVELRRMGQHLTLARYPIHWHLIGEGQGQYIRNAAIHDTYSRCVTVHGTNNLVVENNVTFNTVGHCFFLEDAVEGGNQFIGNLGIQTKCHPTLPCQPTNLAPGGSPPGSGQAGQRSEHVLLPSDNTVSTFWITNPGNDLVGNVAAGSDQIGFWYAFPVNGIGQFNGTENGLNTFPRRTALGLFKGNVAHSNFDGMMFDRGPNPDNTFSVVGSNYHTGFVDPTDPESQRVESVFENFTAYKNRHGGIWGRGKLHLFKDLRLADNAIGFTHAAGDLAYPAFSSKVVDSLFVGESDNIGNPSTPEEIAYGRSLPQEQADYPIRGYEYYDFTQELENVTFRNFEDNATRKTGAISYLMYTSFGISTENSVVGMDFIDAKPVYFPPLEQRWSSDFGSRGGWSGAVFHDKDGSVGGVPGAYIVIDNGIASDPEACEIRPAWNAAVCQGDFGRVGLSSMTGPGPGGPGAPGGPGGPGGLRGAAPAEPIVLSRNGRKLEYSGETTIRSGAELKVETARPELSLSLREMDEDAWVIFELPGFASADGGAEQRSLAALRDASQTSYFKSGDTLWVKLVVEDPAEGGSPLRPSTRIGVRR